VYPALCPVEANLPTASEDFERTILGRIDSTTVESLRKVLTLEGRERECPRCCGSPVAIIGCLCKTKELELRQRTRYEPTDICCRSLDARSAQRWGGRHA
jgi:hypothetical protein